MDQDDYSQFDLGKEDLDSVANYLKDGEVVQAQYYLGKPINIELPVKMDFVVTEAQEGIRGDTASKTVKPVVVETGYKLNVPLFIKQGDRIRINTQTGEYVERAN
jgi:elongation factor P